MTRTRRSLRARRGSGATSPTYNVGDLVEVSRRAGGSSLAKLSSRLTDGTSPNSRWLVHLMDEGGKKDEIYEKSILRLVTWSAEDAGGEDDAAEGPPVDGRKKRGNRGRLPLARGRGSENAEAEDDALVMAAAVASSAGTTSHRNSNNNSSRNHVNGASSSSVSNSPTSDKDQQQAQRRPAARSGAAPAQPAKRGRPLGSKTMTNKTVSFGLDRPKASDKLSVSAREQRSRRRQAKMEDKKKAVGRKSATAAAAAAASTLGDRPRKRKLGASAASTNNSAAVTKGVAVSNTREPDRANAETTVAPAAKKVKSSDPGEEVVKVKLNTGTLYLYRGLRRRAEFVRRY